MQLMFLKACPEKFEQAKNSNLKPGKAVLKKSIDKKNSHIQAPKPKENKEGEEPNKEEKKVGLGLAMFHFM